MGFKMRTLSLPEPRTPEDLLKIVGSPLKRFCFHELAVATNNFSNNNVVGRGGFGSVYRGLLPDGSVVAVKRRRKENSQGGEPQFRAEVEIGCSQASDHRNVLCLRGYCMTRKERLLVYPFMYNASVASRLRDRSDSEAPLDWGTRKRIALGVAKGLAHFHSFSVIHRDVKAANILLDHQFEAVLGDFGLAKFVGRKSNGELANSGWVHRPMEEENQDPFKEEEESNEENKNCFTKSCWDFKLNDDTKKSCWRVTKNEVISISGGDGSGGTIGPPNIDDFTHVTTAVRGTMGHIAPEYLSSGKCSVKTDVYGYGITLLELITGQRVFDLVRLANDDNAMVRDWFTGLVQDNKLELVMDPDLRAEYINDEEEVKQLVQLALLCTQGCPMDRPLMREVVNVIESIGKTLPHHLLSSGWERYLQRLSLEKEKDRLRYLPRLSPEKEKDRSVESPAQSVTESDWMVLGRN